ncbi:unnamed protein product [Lactuca virosa]|uniref:Uncharacterized protein n=1 Tax=Lactuca virosa TaxID=75947 RepID=A0AAU9NYG4_9ASTR|nr:unnamed protein product [Lactuca virosa]
MLLPWGSSGEIDKRGTKKVAGGRRGGIPTATTSVSDQVGVGDGWQSTVVDEFAHFLLCFERIPARGRGFINGGKRIKSYADCIMQSYAVRKKTQSS